MLREYVGGSRDDIMESYDLTAFVGTDPGGTWELIIADDQAGNSGQLVSWSLELEGGL